MTFSEAPAQLSLAKIIARDTGLPIVALPTTYSGSEATPIWGTSEGERKTTGRDTKVLAAPIAAKLTSRRPKWFQFVMR